MPAMPFDAALRTIRRVTGQAAKYRDFAVSDFLPYGSGDDLFGGNRATYPLEARQKAWARYLYEDALAKSGALPPGREGFALKKGASPLFQYTRGATASTPPTAVRKYVANRGDERMPVIPGATIPFNDRVGEIKGRGVCATFANYAWAEIVQRGGGDMPRIEYMFTDPHSWIRANYTERRDAANNVSWCNFIVIDYWFVAMGATMANSICMKDDSAVLFDGTDIVTNTYNPNGFDYTPPV